MKEPKTIVTAGNEKVLATATGTIWGYIIGQAGQRVSVRISIIFVRAWTETHATSSPPSKQCNQG